jgi:beta-lactam-binding protein with PASTA domain
VLRLHPPVGSALAAGERVQLVVAAPTFRMPAITGLTVSEARERLRVRGHDPDQVQIDPPGAGGDQRVVVQRPPAGEPADKLGAVILTAPTTTTLPPTTTPPPTIATEPPLPEPPSSIVLPPTTAPPRR